VTTIPGRAMNPKQNLGNRSSRRGHPTKQPVRCIICGETIWLSQHGRKGNRNICRKCNRLPAVDYVERQPSFGLGF
jgi:ribosomal protein S14